MKALLDVSVLLALAWEPHQFHPMAREWMQENRSLGWATCAITQIGFIRISCQTSIFGEQAKTPDQARLLLSHYTAEKDHTFFSEFPPPTECAEFSKIMGPNKVTDAYLVSVAHFNQARFVTFDKRLAALATDKRRVEVIPTFP